MRHFVSFKQQSTLVNKLMVFTDMQRHQVQDTMVQFYGKAWYKIYSEQEAAQVINHLYERKGNWVQFGEPCQYRDYNCTEGKIYNYPTKFEPEHKVSLESITSWFKTAKPTLSEKSKATQLAAHLEEVNELIEVLKDLQFEPGMRNRLGVIHQELALTTQQMYKLSELPALSQEDRVEILDALADSVVTSSGVAYFLEMKWDEALTEVNQSNFSKFEQGKPLLNDNGKIMKGKNYFKPDLEKFV